MSIQIASLFASIGADTTGLERGLSSAKSGLQNLSGSFSDSALGVGMFITGMNQAAEIARKVAEAVKNTYAAAKEGAAIEYAAIKFDRLSESIGTTADVLLGDMKEATRGVMSDAELVGAAGDLMALGLAKTHDEAVRLTTVSGALGMNMNQLVLALTNQTTARFDQLGVSVDGFAERVKALESAGMSAGDAFKEAFLQQAEAQIAKVGNISDTTAGKIKAMEAAFNNLGDAIKLQLATTFAGLAPVMTEVANSMTEFVVRGANGDLIDAMSVLNDYFISGKISLEQYNEALGYVNNGAMTAAGAVSYVKKNFLEFSETNDDLVDRLFSTSESYAEFVDMMRRSGLDIGMVTEELWLSEKALRGMEYASEAFETKIPKAMQVAGDAISELKDQLADAEVSLAVSIQTFHESVGESVYKGLKEAGLQGEELEKRLKFFDNLAGTDLTFKYKLEVETDDLVDALLDPNFETNFADRFAEFDGMFLPMIEEVSAAQDEVDTLQRMLDDLERTYEVQVRIHTIETTSTGGTGGVGYNPVEAEPNAMGGYELSGTPYLVGERGPELFVPEMNGRVYSNATTNRIAGGGNDALVAAIGRLPTAFDIALAVRDALLMAG